MSTDTDSLGGHLTGDARDPLAAEGQDSPQATACPTPMLASPAGALSTLRGHCAFGDHSSHATEGQYSPQAKAPPAPSVSAPAGTTFTLGGQRARDAHREAAAEGTDSRTAKPATASNDEPPSGPDSPSGQSRIGAPCRRAAEGTPSPQARKRATSIEVAPAGSKTAPPATVDTVPNGHPPEGRKTGRSQAASDAQTSSAAALNSLGGHPCGDAQTTTAEGQTSPQAMGDSAPKRAPLAGTQASRSHPNCDAHWSCAAAEHLPGGNLLLDARQGDAAGDQASPQASKEPAPIEPALAGTKPAVAICLSVPKPVAPRLPNSPVAMRTPTPMKNAPPGLHGRTGNDDRPRGRIR